MKKLLLLTTVLFLSACMQEEPVNPEGNVGMSCTAHVECETPMSYLTRSSCPFASLCIDSRCAVVCPLMTQDPNPEVSESSPVYCKAHTDCNCDSYAPEDLKRCACVNGACMVVVAE